MLVSVSSVVSLLVVVMFSCRRELRIPYHGMVVVKETASRLFWNEV